MQILVPAPLADLLRRDGAHAVDLRGDVVENERRGEIDERCLPGTVQAYAGVEVRNSRAFKGGSKVSPVFGKEDVTAVVI